MISTHVHDYQRTFLGTLWSHHISRGTRRDGGSFSRGIFADLEDLGMGIHLRWHDKVKDVIDSHGCKSMDIKFRNIRTTSTAEGDRGTIFPLEVTFKISKNRRGYFAPELVIIDINEMENSVVDEESFILFKVGEAVKEFLVRDEKYKH